MDNKYNTRIYENEHTRVTMEFVDPDRTYAHYPVSKDIIATQFVSKKTKGVVYKERQMEHPIIF